MFCNFAQLSRAAQPRLEALLGTKELKEQSVSQFYLKPVSKPYRDNSGLLISNENHLKIIKKIVIDVQSAFYQRASFIKKVKSAIFNEFH